MRYRKKEFKMERKMNKKETYDRAAVGERLKGCRKRMGLSRAFIAQKIGIVEKYYADIERGNCGMSVETMMALAKYYNLSLDEFIYGEDAFEEDTRELSRQLEKLSPGERKYCTEMLSIFIGAMKSR